MGYTDGIITLPIAIFGFLYFPDTPEKTKASYITEKEKRMAIARVPSISRDGHNIMPLSLIKRVFCTPTL
jgi:ACS family pantothenate transporter-like MFS transporter